MALIPKTVGDLKKCLEVYADSVEVYVEDDEGFLWNVSLDKQALDFSNYDKGVTEVIVLSIFERFILN